MHSIIKLCCIRTRAQVKYKPDFWFIRIEPLKKIIPFNLVREFFILEVINFIQAAELVHEDQLAESFFIQKSGKTTADKPGSSCYDDSGRSGHASTIDSISFSMAVSYSCFHSRILPQFAPSTCTIAVVTVPNSSRGIPCMAFLNSAIFSFLT